MRASRISTAFFWVAFAAAPPARADYQLSQQEAQLASQRDAQRRYQDTANRARNAGRDSIGRGGRHMNHGKHHHDCGEINSGAFEIAQGILGFLASLMADGLSDKDNGNGNNLDRITGGGDSAAMNPSQYAASGPQADITSRASSALGSSNGSGKANIDKLDANALGRDPETKQAMAAIEDRFGISPADLVAKLKNGEDPKSIFENAPQNALTHAEALAGYKASRAGLADVKDPAPASVAASAAAPGTDAAAGGAPDKLGRSGLRDSLSRSMGSGDDLELSPEVRAALAAREDAERKRNQHVKSEEEMDLFEVVHRKYLEREDNLRWGKALRTAEGWGP
jgi:hypothetical protein